jgi:multicomponent Na+:H+ antiporter subunit D
MDISHTLVLALTVVGGPLYEITHDAATDLMSRTPYVDAVLPGGAP